MKRQKSLVKDSSETADSDRKILDIFYSISLEPFGAANTVFCYKIRLSKYYKINI